MTTTLTYLFDPLCGWCYGASPAIEVLSQQSDLIIELAPTGLFAGKSGRTMDADFAEYAWANDVRIEKMTGQRFTAQYRQQILGQHGSRFDSDTATLALTAVSLTNPQRELETLKLFQEARYVQGEDITSLAVAQQLLRSSGLVDAAGILVPENQQLRHINNARLARAQQLLQSFAIRGVPRLILTDDTGSRLLDSDQLFQPAGELRASLGLTPASANVAQSM